MDALEAIGRHQINQNTKLIENYEMVRGKFIYSHYIEREEYGDLMTQLTNEFEMPSHLRHYDIVSQVINTLSGEYQKRPDIFRVRSRDENAKNNYSRKKTELLMEYVMQEINGGIEAQLAKEGLDPNKQDFASQEEQQQYQQQIEQRRGALTPPEVERYMQTQWMDAAEIWAEHQLEHDKDQFNLPEKEKVEFEDMLIADRCFRHFYLTPFGHSQETWNTIHTFYHKSPEVTYIENGDYVGRILYVSLPDIINRYGHKMTESDILLLEAFKNESYKAKQGFGSGEATYSGLTAGTGMPHQNYDEQKFVSGHLGFDPNNPESTNHNIDIALGSGDAINNMNKYGLYEVTEAYWMSQRKIGKYVYNDYETGEVMVMLVDETFSLPGVKERENSFLELGNDLEPNTITWTWVNEVYKGIKINNRYNNLAKPLYIDVGVAEFQFRGDLNIYGAKLPVCGQIFNNRNAESMSLVDLMKPHQIGYNVAMNQLYEIMQREIGRFMLMDMNFIPSGKDWGGEHNFEKLMLVAKQLGIAPLDGSPANTKQSSFSHFQEIDLDESARMISRLKIAEAFENFALKQVGITPQRLGATTASESATGVQQAVNQSYAQTESHFTNFSNYKRRCLQMNLEIAQYVQSKKENVQLAYVKSDMSRAFVEIAGTDLLLSEFGVRVANSAEEVRKLEMMRQLFLENNTTGANPTDLATVIMSNSPAEIKAQLAASWKAQQAQQQQQMQSEQQGMQAQIQAAAEEAEKKRQFEAEQAELDRANERYITEVRALGSVGLGGNPDIDGSGVPDVLEVQKLNMEMGKHTEDILFKRQEARMKLNEQKTKADIEKDKVKLEKERMSHEKEENEKDRQVERENMVNDLAIEKQRAKNKPKPSSK
jgi:hypothetical protein